MDSKIKKVLDDNYLDYSFYNLSTKEKREYSFKIKILGYELNFKELDDKIKCIDGQVIDEVIDNFTMDYILNEVRYKNTNRDKNDRYSRERRLRRPVKKVVTTPPTTRMCPPVEEGITILEEMFLEEYTNIFGGNNE